MMGMFKRAVKAQSFLRMALAGTAGSGKTYSALAIGSALAEGRPVAVIDTERGSASKYADMFAFDVLELGAPYHPDRYVEAIKEAAAAGYAVLIIDSLTHAWNGSGGLLELIEQIAKRSYSGNTFRAWAEGTPIQNRLIDALTGTPLHIIVTMRSKSEYVVEQNDKGRATPRKVGMKVEQRDDIEYVFDIYGDMTQEHELIIRKTRCPTLTDALIHFPGAEVAEILRQWLSGAPVPQAVDSGMTTTTATTATTTEADDHDDPNQRADVASQTELVEWLKEGQFGSVGAVERFLAQTLKRRMTISALSNGASNITVGEVAKVTEALAARREAMQHQQQSQQAAAAAAAAESQETANFEDLPVLNGGVKP